MRVLLSCVLVAALLAGCAANAPLPAAKSSPARRTLTILTHDSYYIDESVIRSFEAAHDAQVRTVPAGDAGAALNVAILNKDHPIADLFYGVDNALLARALDAGVLAPYEPANATKIDPRFVFDPTWHVTPVDYGYVALNYDVAALKEAGLSPPASLDEIAKDPKWKGKLVVENPATSSPGMAFLLATVAHFGSEGSYTYKDFWADLKKNDVAVASGWTAAYFEHFSGGGAGGDRPLVVSYTTSPPYAVREACTVDGKYAGLAACPAEKKAMPTGALDVPGGAWLQIEAMGVLNNSGNADLARAFIEHALTSAYQESASYSMFVYPVTKDAKVPDFLGLVEEPKVPATIEAAKLTKPYADAVTKGWMDVMLH
jgi:thiamine transport system substrate-binding protein